MGIRFTCPSGHKLHVKAFLAGKRGVCPHCGAKFVIPSDQESEKLPARSTHEDGQRASIEAFTASASIIIGVADDHVESASPSDNDASAMRLAEDFGSPANDPPAPPPQSAFLAASAAESPVVRHISRRERHRRKQFNMAIVLLVAVILLALVLIWIVQRGLGQSSAGDWRLNRLVNAWPSAATHCIYLS
jgi:hypothetical protein